jgi:hypothetical protein
VLRTRAPLTIASPFDLHVLGPPQTFALSQDQTLQFELVLIMSDGPRWRPGSDGCRCPLPLGCRPDGVRTFVRDPTSVILVSSSAIQFSGSVPLAFGRGRRRGGARLSSERPSRQVFRRDFLFHRSARRGECGTPFGAPWSGWLEGRRGLAPSFLPVKPFRSTFFFVPLAEASWNAVRGPAAGWLEGRRGLVPSFLPVKPLARLFSADLFPVHVRFPVRPSG